ncbi:hypothetical protein [Xylanibacter oryzae]|uniref:hypothetical protein n=1 Tax=Xylanibacter oryzae TaxID=185293 RepID=UPI0004B08541|nr:hypothetical protein [Xylanibacter oryzae]
MECLNENMELEQLREQLSILKSKLEKETIVNDRLMRNAMKNKAKNITRNGWIISIIAMIGIPYCTWANRYLLNMSWWFVVVTDIFFLIAIIYNYFTYKHIHANQLMEGNLVDVSSDIIRMKRMHFNWLKFSIPFMILWLSWFIVENLDAYDAKYVLIGVIFGCIIGGILGISFFRRDRRMMSEILDQIKDLTEND